MATLSLDDLARLEGPNAPPVAAPSGPLPVVVRPLGIVPPTGVENAGTPGATMPAAVSSALAVPPAVATADASPKPSEGATDFDVMMEALWQTESGNRQTDPKTGKIITSSSGALGTSQLMPGTAASLGVDPHDEAQNRAGGKKYLAQQFTKYGNYRDALGAYFAGPGAYDKWLDSGSKRDSKIGQQITKYQDTVLARAGIIERGVSAARAPDGSRVLSGADMDAILNDLPPATPEEAETRARSKRDREGGTFLEESTDRAKALTYGLYKGARNFMLAPAEALMEQVAPESARGLAARVAEVDKPWEPLMNRHSYLGTAGEIIGGTTALLGAMRLLGPPVAAAAGAAGITTALAQVAPRVPWLLNSAGGLTTAGRYAASVPTGAAITAGTIFTESANPSDRIWLAGLGGIAGPLGVALGQGLAKAYKFASTKGELARMMDALKANAAVVEPDLNALKRIAVDRIGKMEQSSGRLYESATAQGKVAPGVEAKALDAAILGYRTKAASEINSTKQAVRVAMGLDKEAERAATAATLRQQYADQVRGLTKAQEEYVDKYISRDALPEARAAIRRDLDGRDPGFPRATMVEPPAYVPRPISAEQLMHGRQVIEREKRSAGTRAKRNQLVGLKFELNNTIAAVARDAGMSTSEFYRKLLKADNYYKSNVVPAHDVLEDWFGRRFRGANQIADDATNKLTQGVDGTKIFEKVVTTVETGTQREVAAMMHVFGTTPRDKERLVRSLAFRALTKKQPGILDDFDPAAVNKYINDNHKNLSRVLTTEQYNWMRGFAKVSESLANQAKASVRDSNRFIWSSRVLNILGLERIGHGDAGGGVKLILSGMFAHTLMNNVPKLRMLPTARLVGRAANLSPDSPEFRRLAGQIEVQLAKSAIVSARAAGDRSGIGDKPAQSFQPVAPMPAR